MDDEVNDILSNCKNLYDTISLFKLQLNNLQQHVKKIEKNIERIQKKTHKSNTPTTHRKPSGFAKPSAVTRELCEFVNKPEGSLIARTEVTKTLVNYIKEHNLVVNTKGEKQKIIPDNKLQKLLNIGPDESDDLTYFTIQKYMNQHFLSTKKHTNVECNNTENY